MKLTSESDLAAMWGLDEKKVAELRRRHGWPHVRLGRFDVRYTDTHLEQIVASASVAGERDLVAETGLTRRSARRAS